MWLNFPGYSLLNSIAFVDSEQSTAAAAATVVDVEAAHTAVPDTKEPDAILASLMATNKLSLEVSCGPFVCLIFVSAARRPTTLTLVCSALLRLGATARASESVNVDGSSRNFDVLQ